eukprot:IDg12685t1
MCCWSPASRYDRRHAAVFTGRNGRAHARTLVELPPPAHTRPRSTHSSYRYNGRAARCSMYAPIAGDRVMAIITAPASAVHDGTLDIAQRRAASQILIQHSPTSAKRAPGRIPGRAWDPLDDVALYGANDLRRL